MKDITKLKCKVERCGHQWFPRDYSIDPLVCPKCKSYNWNVETEEKDDNKN